MVISIQLAGYECAPAVGAVRLAGASKPLCQGWLGASSDWLIDLDRTRAANSRGLVAGESSGADHIFGELG